MAKNSLSHNIKHHKSKLEKDGYFVIKLSSINVNINNLSKNLSKKIIDSEFKGFPNNKIKKCKNLEEVINKIYYFDKKNKKNNISFLYKLINKFPSLYAFSYSNLIENFFKKLGYDILSLGTLPLIRIERPKNKSFLTPWHQDKWYSGNFSNSFVIWFPLIKANNVGGIEIIPASHKKGFIKFKKRGKNYNERNEAIIDKKTQSKKIRLKFNEAIIFNQFLVHRSLENNSSQNCRVSCQIRFNSIKKTDPSKVSFQVVHSNEIKKLHKKLLKK